jgi:hypothetical protein
MYLAFTSQSPPKHKAFTWLAPPMYLASGGFDRHFIIHHSSFILRFVCLRPPLRHSMLDVGCWMLGSRPEIDWYFGMRNSKYHESNSI